MPGKFYRLGNIHRLLTQEFSNDELYALWFDIPDLRSKITEYNFESTTKITDIVANLIRLTEETSQIDTLLALAKERKPISYEKYQPYYLADATPILQKQIANLTQRLSDATRITEETLFEAQTKARIAEIEAKGELQIARMNAEAKQIEVETRIMSYRRLIDMLKTEGFSEDTIKSFLHYIGQSLIANDLYPEDIDIQSYDQKRLSIRLESNLNLGQFAEKLAALNVIYTTLANIVNVSLTEHPLQIRNIQSGSLWADLLGYPKLISIMERMINETTSYLHRNFTKEGKISSIPQKVEVLDSILNLRNKLQMEGIDTSELDDEINRGSIKVVQQLNALLVGEPKVWVNLEIHYIGKELEKNFLEERMKYLLPESTND